ncbi:MAG: tRNA (adenosine(37)-N6)-threonylcarbamoyltransferase complex ATPase subunit type 1 TsaE [Aureliella sp.]
MTTPIIKLPDLDATRRLASDIADRVEVPQTIALNGTLGVGKTQWIRFFSQAIGADAGQVTSPTYVLHQRYRGRLLIHHFDFYRLETSDEVWNLGIDELFEQPAVVLIEWADKFADCLPDDYLQIKLSHHEVGGRQAELFATGPTSAKLLSQLTH